MAWSAIATGGDTVVLTGITTYPADNLPACAAPGIIVSTALPGSPADGDVLVVVIRRSVLMSRVDYPPLRTFPETYFPMGSTSAELDPSDYGLAVVSGPLGFDETCEIRRYAVQILDATAFATLPAIRVNLQWDDTPDPGTESPVTWGSDANDSAYIILGWTLYRSDTNPTWPLDFEQGKRGCGYVSFPATGMRVGMGAYVHVGAADGDTTPLSSPPSPWTESVNQQETVGGRELGLATSHVFTTPSANADWLTEDGYGESGADGGGLVDGSMYVAWKAYDPGDPPVVIEDVPASVCSLHIPHPRWMEAKSKRQVEENWHAVESWAADFLTNDACRPCAEYLTPPVE